MVARLRCAGAHNNYGNSYAIYENGVTGQWLCRRCPKEYTLSQVSMLQLVNVAFQFLFMSGSVETTMAKWKIRPMYAFNS